MFAFMVIKELYRNFLVQLQVIYNLNEATKITDWVFEKIAVITRSDIIKNPTKELNPSIINRLNEALTKLLEHKPIQYILEEAWFYNFKLYVNDQVLIPRPETEELVEWLITNRKFQLTDPVILDIGTGSGCISIAIKKNLPASIVTAIDCSENALEVAKKNATALGTDVNFLQLDFLDKEQWKQLPSFDIIISNPPYVPEKDKQHMNANVLHYEPATALFVPDNDPLVFYKAIAEFGKTQLNKSGSIYTEIHESLGQAAVVAFQSAGYISEIKKDMQQKDRMVKAVYSL